MKYFVRATFEVEASGVNEASEKAHSGLDSQFDNVYIEDGPDEAEGEVEEEIEEETESDGA